MSPTPPRIAVTMGDPAGIGPEICLRLLANELIASECIPIVFGDAEVLIRASDACGIHPPAHMIKNLEDEKGPGVLDLGAMDLDALDPGVVSAATGKAAYRYIEAAIEAAISGKVDAVVTAPINKEALHAAGIAFPGHTEIFSAKTQSKRTCMMQYSDEITCSFVTVHVGYREVPELLTVARIVDVIELTAEALLRIRGRQPVLTACGLNPHAGEHGLFGHREEERVIIPALDAARAKGIRIEGPLPPDTAFTPDRRHRTDAVICMYHDQGHIPVKALAFDKAVNVTLGLPIVRTSVDHGTALDIAWQGKANAGSLFQAVRLACQLAGTPQAREAERA